MRRKVVIGIILLILLFLFVDSINLFSYGNKNINYHNINIYNWVVFSSSLFAVLGTYIFTSLENEKKMKQETDQHDEIIAKQKKQHEEIIENEREIQDKNLIINYYHEKKIREATMWIRDTKKYKFKIEKMIDDPINNLPTINEINSKDMDSLVLNFRKDIKNMYYLYEDIELLNLSFINKENRKFVEKIIEKRKGNGVGEGKTMKAPRNLITTKKEKKLEKIKSIEEYKCLVKEYRRKYKDEMLDLIKAPNKNKKEVN